MSLQRLGVLLVSVLLAGCRGHTETESRPVVAVSVVPQAFFVQQIAADRVRVAVMMPPGANPSTYGPGIDALTSFSDAILYVAVGHPHFAFERAWMARLLSERPRLPVVRMNGHALGDDDPHVWVSPRLVRAQAEGIASALGKVLVDDREAFERNLAQFLGEIDTLDSEIRERLRRYEGRKVFVFHAAWGHFTREYGLLQVSLEEGMKEPGAGALASFIEEARRGGAKTIFVQPQFSRASARVVAEEMGASVETLDPLASDWLENMRRVAVAFEKALGP